jgi:hypothetical protein
MTMPLTADVMKTAQVNCPCELSKKQLADAINGLRHDLPGALEFIEESAQLDRSEQGWAYLSRKPAEMMSRQEWDTLVSRLLASSRVRTLASSRATCARRMVSYLRSSTVAL